MLKTMSIITLTTDWGWADYYVAAVKGVILSKCPDSIIVDVSHDVAHHNRNSAAFILRNAYPNFPKGTIHVIGVDSEEALDKPHVVVECEGHYFIGADNGVFSLIIGEKPYKAVYIDLVQDTEYFTFPTRDRFAKTAASIAHGMQLSDIGKPYEITRMVELQPAVKADSIQGMVTYIDDFGNAITNISKELFQQVGAGRKFKIILRAEKYTIDKISDSYHDVPIPEMVAIFGSHGFVEIANNMGNLSELLGIARNTEVFVNFE